MSARASLRSDDFERLNHTVGPFGAELPRRLNVHEIRRRDRSLATFARNAFVVLVVVVIAVIAIVSAAIDLAGFVDWFRALLTMYGLQCGLSACG